MRFIVVSPVGPSLWQRIIITIGVSLWSPNLLAQDTPPDAWVSLYSNPTGVEMYLRRREWQSTDSKAIVWVKLIRPDNSPKELSFIMQQMFIDCIGMKIRQISSYGYDKNGGLIASLKVVQPEQDIIPDTGSYGLAMAVCKNVFNAVRQPTPSPAP